MIGPQPEIHTTQEECRKRNDEKEQASRFDNRLIFFSESDDGTDLIEHDHLLIYEKTTPKVAR